MWLFGDWGVRAGARESPGRPQGGRASGGRPAPRALPEAAPGPARGSPPAAFQDDVGGRKGKKKEEEEGKERG